jgi:uncharacterized protein YqeY
MDIKSQLTEDMKQAMRDKDTDKLGTIRFLLSEIKNVEIDEGVQDDAGVQKIISRQIKQIRDARSDFERAGRTDLVEQEDAKLAVLEAYLPAQLSDNELEALVDEAIAESVDKNMGKIIGAVMQKAAGQADGGRVAAAVRNKLQ